jgi:hypothetical protein
MPIFYRIRRRVAPSRLQEPLYGPQIIGANRWSCRQPHATTRRPIKHPLRQFQRPRRLVGINATTKNGAIAPNHPLQHVDLTTMPGMPGIEDFLEDRTMGLAS